VALAEVTRWRAALDAGAALDARALSPHLAAVLLKALVRDLPEPLLGFGAFADVQAFRAGAAQGGCAAG